MKILIAMMSHETNTFSPVPTPLTRFGAGRDPLEGDVIQQTYQNRSSTMAGMLAEASKHDVELVTPIAAGAPPSGKVDQQAYQYMSDKICDAPLAAMHCYWIYTGPWCPRHTMTAKGPCWHDYEADNPPFPSV